MGETGGRKFALDHAREKVRKVRAERQPRQLDPALGKELDQFRQMVAERDLNDFYNYEQPENQDFDNL